MPAVIKRGCCGLVCEIRDGQLRRGDGKATGLAHARVAFRWTWYHALGRSVPDIKDKELRQQRGGRKQAFKIKICPSELKEKFLS